MPCWNLSMALGIMLLTASLISCSDPTDNSQISTPTALSILQATDLLTPTVASTTLISITTTPIMISDTKTLATETPNTRMSELNQEEIGKYIYLVKSSMCKRDSLVNPPIHIQTGSRIKNHRGIITALHGVIGCESIVAVSDSKDLGRALATLSNLEIVEVDIAHDVALLLPKDLEVQQLLNPEEGLETVTDLPPLDCDRDTRFDITLWGYPRPYSSLISRSGKVTCSPLLRERMPSDQEQQNVIIKRRSPSVSTYILDVDIPATQGHSGAPILVASNSAIFPTGHNRVVGLVLGGLQETRVSNAWAAPWPDITLQPVERFPEEIAALEEDELSESLMTYMGNETDPSPTPTLTGLNNIEVETNVWNRTYLRIPNVEFYGSGQAWLVIFLNRSDPFTDMPLASVLIPSNTRRSVLAYIYRDDVGQIVKEIDDTLTQGDTVWLVAYLFADKEQENIFNPTRGFPPGDILIQLASGGSSRGFSLISKKDELSTDSQ